MKAVVILSGGMDSATLLYYYRSLIKDPASLKAISFDYGQRHAKELKADQDIARLAGVEHRIVDLTYLRHVLTGSSQTDTTVEVPKGHYADENMKKTVVPNRNMIMISVAVSWAVSMKFDRVAYGAHAGDHTIYPDCRLGFIAAMDMAVHQCDWHQVALEAPFALLTKGEICRLGERLSVPFQFTWTCYVGGETPCGECGACRERAVSFEYAGVSDPTMNSIPVDVKLGD